MKKTTLLLVFFFSASSILAQRTVVGKALDEHGEPLLGTSVSHKEFPENNEAVFIDFDGNYSLEVPVDCEKLYYSYEWTWEVPLAESDTLNVVLVYGYYNELKMEDKPCGREYPISVSGTVDLMGRETKATIQVRGSEIRAQTDGDGHFSLTVLSGHDVLVFSADEHITAEVRLGEAGTLFIPMRLHKPVKKKKWWQFFRRG